MTTSTVLLIRHGQSAFNAAYGSDGVDPMLFDAPLSPLGHEQVAAARLALLDIPVEVVLTSPLTRALQTALGLFADHPNRPTLVVETLHRERLESSCDRGRSPADLRVDFPDVALDHLPATWWHDDGEPDGRGLHVEPFEVMLARVHDFAAALRDRTEATIAVVGHGTFFHQLTGRWLNNCEIVAWDGRIHEMSPVY